MVRKHIIIQIYYFQLICLAEESWCALRLLSRVVVSKFHSLQIAIMQPVYYHIVCFWICLFLNTMFPVESIAFQFQVFMTLILNIFIFWHFIQQTEQREAKERKQSTNSSPTNFCQQYHVCHKNNVVKDKVSEHVCEREIV